MTGPVPGPSEPPAVQTLRWLARPIAFLESCRRRYGDTFAVRFLGFETPMIMVSDPQAVRDLYGERGHGLPPGRTVALRPIVGARSLLLLEGKEHLARRKLDAAAVPRRAHARVRGDRRRGRRPRPRDVADAASRSRSTRTCSR